jgi:hypothetical protein
MNRALRFAALSAVLLLPALLGASCSTNAVAESAATSFFDELASSLADAIVAAISPAEG